MKIILRSRPSIFKFHLMRAVIFLLGKFLHLQSQQAGRVGSNLQFFESDFLQIRLQKHLLGFAQTRYSAQNCADCASSLTLNKQISCRKIRFQKIVVDSFNIVQKRKYHFLKNRAILWYALSRAVHKNRTSQVRFSPSKPDLIRPKNTCLIVIGFLQTLIEP